MTKEDRIEMKMLQKELAFVGFVEFIRAEPQLAYLLSDAYVDLIKSISNGKAVVRPGEESEYADQKAAIVAMLKKVLPGLEVVSPEEAERRDAEREARELAEDSNPSDPSGKPPEGTLLN